MISSITIQSTNCDRHTNKLTTKINHFIFYSNLTVSRQNINYINDKNNNKGNTISNGKATQKLKVSTVYIILSSSNNNNQYEWTNTTLSRSKPILLSQTRSSGFYHASSMSICLLDTEGGEELNGIWFNLVSCIGFKAWTKASSLVEVLFISEDKFKSE